MEPQKEPRERQAGRAAGSGLGEGAGRQGQGPVSSSPHFLGRQVSKSPRTCMSSQRCPQPRVVHRCPLLASFSHILCLVHQQKFSKWSLKTLSSPVSSPTEIITDDPQLVLPAVAASAPPSAARVTLPGRDHHAPPQFNGARWLLPWQRGSPWDPGGLLPGPARHPSHSLHCSAFLELQAFSPAASSARDVLPDTHRYPSLAPSHRCHDQ